MPTRIVELILEIVKLSIEGQPPEVRAELWRRHMEFLERGDAFWERIGKVLGGDREDRKRPTPAAS